MTEVEAYARLAGVYDEIVVDPCYVDWARHLDSLWVTDPSRVDTVLDVCCGTGLMDAELIRLGYRIVGIDASEPMLERARTLLGPDVELLRQTLPHLLVDGMFDAAISTFDGLNYLTPHDLQATLVALAARVRPGGWLVFDLHTDAMLDFTAANPVVEGVDHGHHFVIRSDVDLGARTCDARIDVTRDGDAFSEHHLQHFHGDAAVRAALSAAGFAVQAITDEYSSVPVHESTLRATWVARRVPLSSGG